MLDLFPAETPQIARQTISPLAEELASLVSLVSLPLTFLRLPGLPPTTTLDALDLATVHFDLQGVEAEVIPLEGSREGGN